MQQQAHGLRCASGPWRGFPLPQTRKMRLVSPLLFLLLRFRILPRHPQALPPSLAANSIYSMKPAATTSALQQPHWTLSAKGGWDSSSPNSQQGQHEAGKKYFPPNARNMRTGPPKASTLCVQLQASPDLSSVPTALFAVPEPPSQRDNQGLSPLIILQPGCGCQPGKEQAGALRLQNVRSEKSPESSTDSFAKDISLPCQPLGPLDTPAQVLPWVLFNTD